MNGKKVKLSKDFLLKLIVVTGLLLGLFSSISLAQDVTTYYIRTGDTLASIAEDHETTVERLLSLNPSITDSNNIHVGDVIQVPTIAEVEPGTAVAQCARPYTVQADDTWSTIAKAHGVPTGILAEVNNMAVTDSLIVGSSLCLPAALEPVVQPPAQLVVDSEDDDSDMDSGDSMLAPTSSPAPAPTPNALPRPGEGEGVYHRVLRGEYLSLIARRYNCTARTLAAVNNIANPSLVYVNTLLWVPANCASLQRLLPAVTVPVSVPRAPAPRPRAPAPAPQAPQPSVTVSAPPAPQPGAPVPAPQPQAPVTPPPSTRFNYQSHGPWTGSYFNNPNVEGGPAVTRQDAQIVFDWGPNSPASGIPTDGFSVKWVGTFFFTGGNYRFIAIADDGIRVWVDDALIINGWQDQSKTMYFKDHDLRYGNHTVRVEYYDSRLDAIAVVNWARR